MDSLDILTEFQYLVESGRVSPPVVISLTPTLPRPNKSDYERGWIERFFAQKTNDPNSMIVEVSSNLHMLLQSMAYYRTTSLRWVIRGQENAVSQSNENILIIAEETMPGISLRLPNLTQFRR